MRSEVAGNSARRLIGEEQYTRALEAADAALATDPQDADLIYLKSVALLGVKRYAEALPLIVQALTSASADARKWLALCSTLRTLGFVELALQVNAYALNQVSSPDFELTRFRGDTLFRDYRYDEALDAYQPALTQFGQQAQAWPIWYNYAACLAEEGNATDAREANRRALRTLQQLLATGSVTSETHLATLWYYQGVLFARLDRWATAEELLVRSLRVELGSYEIALWLHAACKAQHKRVSAALILPWVFWNGMAKKRRDEKEQQDIMNQRASAPQATLDQVRELIDL